MWYGTRGLGSTFLWISGKWDSIPQKLFGWEYRLRSSLCTHAYHCTDSKDPGILVLDGWMPATKTPSIHHPQRQNVTTSVASHTQTSHPKWWTPEIKLGNAEEEGDVDALIIMNGSTCSQLVKGVSAPRNPDCFQKVPKKVSLLETGQVHSVSVDCDSEYLLLLLGVVCVGCCMMQLVLSMMCVRLCVCACVCLV